MAANTMYVTVAGAGDKSGMPDWDNAMGYDEWEADAEGSAEAGDIYYVKEGEYSLTRDFTVTAGGGSTAYIVVIGVKTETTNEPPVFSDWAFGTDRPLITCAGYSFVWDNYTLLYNLRGTGTDDDVFYADSHSRIHNCAANNSGAATRDAIATAGNYSSIINCDGQSANGHGLSQPAGAFARILFSYGHDSVKGIYVTSGATMILFCIADNCTDGLDMYEGYAYTVMNNTIYDCSGAGILNRGGTTMWDSVLINNIVNDCENGISMLGVTETNFLAYNNIEGSGTADWVNGPADYGADHWETNNDPKFTTAGSDFSLQSDSDCREAGMSMILGVGA